MASTDDLYREILAGYQASANQFNAVSGGINAGYLKMIADNQNIGESDRTALRQQYAKAGGNIQQSLVSRGMGNTGVLTSAQRGLEYDKANATTALNDSVARRQQALMGQYLGYNAQYAAQAADIAQRQMGFQGSVLGQRYSSEVGLANQKALMEAETQQKLSYARQMAAMAPGGSSAASSDPAGSGQAAFTRDKDRSAAMAMQAKALDAAAAGSAGWRSYGNQMPNYSAPQSGGINQGGPQTIDYGVGWAEGDAYMPGVLSPYERGVSGGAEDYGLGALNSYLGGGTEDYGQFNGADYGTY